MCGMCNVVWDAKPLTYVSKVRHTARYVAITFYSAYLSHYV